MAAAGRRWRPPRRTPQLFPQWTPALRDALGEETRRFVEHVFTEGDRRLETLLSAPFSFLDGRSPPTTACPGGAGRGRWQRVDLPADQRAGLLTQAGLMATLAHENRTSFILRGKMVREALFCTAPLPPPPDAPAEPKLDPSASAKARSEAHRTDPACATCHELFDPLGFAFEIYDATGRYRTSDAAGPIDAKVTLTPHRAAGRPDGRQRGRAGAAAGRRRRGPRLRGPPVDALRPGPRRRRRGRAVAGGGGEGLQGRAGPSCPALLVAIARSDAFRYQKVGQ